MPKDMSSIIEYQFDELFGREVLELGVGMIMEGRRGGRCNAQALAQLQRDIVDHWRELNERLKRRIRNKFRVDDSTDPIKISLM